MGNAYDKADHQAFDCRPATRHHTWQRWFGVVVALLLLVAVVFRWPQIEEYWFPAARSQRGTVLAQGQLKRGRGG
ncbi:MAG: hypothetical protein AB7O62_26585 [Pirellulales bacterium]